MKTTAFLSAPTTSSMEYSSEENSFSKEKSVPKSSNSKAIVRSTDYKPISNDIRRKVCFENQVLKVSLSKICKTYNINFLSAKNVI